MVTFSQGTSWEAGIRSYAAISQCLNRWEQVITNGESISGIFPFRMRWDFSAQADDPLVNEVGLAIARAGEALSKFLFSGGDDLNEIRDRLFREISAPRDPSKPLLLTVHSDDLFAPWWMLYTCPDGTPPLYGPSEGWQLEGFWGYKHLVEHQTSRVPNAQRETKVAGPRIRLGLNVDPNIDTEFATPFVAQVKSFLKGKAVRVTREKRRSHPGLPERQILR